MRKGFWIFLIILLVLLFILFSLFPGFFGLAVSYNKSEQEANTAQIENMPVVPVIPPLDTAAYDLKINELANNPPPLVVVQKFDEVTGEPISPPPPKPTLWPVKTVYPEGGALLPFNRIIAYYGNLYSTKMGVLGQYPEAEMFQRLGVEMEKWKNADPATPVIPALHYIAVVAQSGPGEDGKYRARMPHSEIGKVLEMAAKINAIVFLDLQVGFSNVLNEIPLLEKYLKLPNVHLGIDPEFSMKGGIRPGKVVGTYDAEDINFTTNYLAKIVRD